MRSGTARPSRTGSAPVIRRSAPSADDLRGAVPREAPAASWSTLTRCARRW